MSNTFEVTSGKLIVTDPCYQGLDNRCNHLIDNCAKGTWHVFTEESYEGYWGDRVSSLTLEFDGYSARDCIFTTLDGMVAVDSGQAGAFDYDKWSKLDRDFDFEYDSSTSFYSKCCEGTSREDVAVLDFGACSSSGFGDGCYPCEIYTNVTTNLVEKVVINFIERDDYYEDE